MMTKTQVVSNIIQSGLYGDPKKGVDILKKVLSDNGYKHTFNAARVMLANIPDEDMDEESRLYWNSVAVNLE